MTRSFGCKRDSAAKRTQKDARRHPLMAAMPVPREASLEQYEAPTLNQGNSSSCVGHSCAQAIYTAFAAAGMPLPWVPSPHGIYGVARMTERLPAADGTLPPLADEGTMPADAMTGVSSFGIRPIQAPTSDGRYSDVEPMNVNAEQSLKDFEDDAGRIITGEYRIDEKALDVVNQICAAIASGFPVVVGTMVDDAFERWSPGMAPIGAPDPTKALGGHAIVIVSYKTDASGRRVARIKNSWGAWADNGHAEVSEEWMRACWDLYPMAVARKT